VSTISIIFVALTILLHIWSLISLRDMNINVITQSPFFLYGNFVYITSVIIITATLFFTIYLSNSFVTSLIQLFALWSLILIAPYIIYLRSLPLYNDQLGYVLEALQGILQGHIKPVQGELSSLGHAYFTSVYTLICGFDPMWGVIIVQIMLPILYLLPLLAVKHETFYDKIFVAIVMLAAILNPIFYGRTSFAWSYLIFLTFYLYNKFFRAGQGRQNISMIMTLVLIYIAYVISDPTSLIIPIILSIATMFNKKLILSTISTIITWFTINLVMYLSGSLYSVIIQLMALIEHPVNPVPSLIAPSVNPIIKLYNYLRELDVFLNFFIGLVLVLTMIFRIKRDIRRENELIWVALYLFLVGLQLAALVMNRWGMVPYSIYVLTVLPALILLGSRNRLLKITTLSTAILLLTLSPVIKWGFSSIAFPTSHDLNEVDYLVRYVSSQMTICASGAHVMADFYFRLYDIKTSLKILDPLPLINQDQMMQCNYIATFYRSFNIYRLDISESLLISLITKFDINYSLIYRDNVWSIWLR